MRAILRKLARLGDTLLVVAHLPVILVIRLIRPVLWIRFGWIQTHKIGHLPLEPEFYLCERRAGLQPARAVDFFYERRRSDKRRCNDQAVAMVYRNLRISPWVEYFYRANRLLPGAAAHDVYIKAREEYGVRDRDGLFSRFPVQIDFTPAEVEAGALALEKMGVPRGAKFVCVHVRDAAYWRSRKADINNDSDFRNSDIADFIPAMEALLDKGYYVLRVGTPVSTRLPIEHPHFVDYAADHRTVFLDVFLAGTCHFMISTASGLDSVSYMFRRPTLMCNLAPVGLAYSDSPRIVNMLKLHRRSGTTDLLSYPEVHRIGADDFRVTNDFIRHGIDCVDVSPAMIRAAALEMAARQDGSWVETEEDKELDRRFWALYADDPFHGVIRGRLSGEFLRQYRELF